MVEAAREARAAREKLLVHCADGHAATGLALAAWLLLDYIGSDNVQEAIDCLTATKRKFRVERRPEPEALAAFVGVEYEPPVEFEEAAPPPMLEAVAKATACCSAR